uniref:(northern house mosquito) hypothetical protein n=1 Tax=Culex pipiens TaxID=7175 RepID=A0A8D8KT24_CULPI
MVILDHGSHFSGFDSLHPLLPLEHRQHHSATGPELCGFFSWPVLFPGPDRRLLCQPLRFSFPDFGPCSLPLNETFHRWVYGFDYGCCATATTTYRRRTRRFNQHLWRCISAKAGPSTMCGFFDQRM